MGTAMSLSSPCQQTFLHTSSVPGPGDTKCESDQLCPGSGIRLHTRPWAWKQREGGSLTRPGSRGGRRMGEGAGLVTSPEAGREDSRLPAPCSF